MGFHEGTWFIMGILGIIYIYTIYICGEDLLGLFRSYVHMSTRALNYDLGQGSLGYGLTFWPSFTCVCRLPLG